MLTTAIKGLVPDWAQPPTSDLSTTWLRGRWGPPAGRGVYYAAATLTSVRPSDAVDTLPTGLVDPFLGACVRAACGLGKDPVTDGWASVVSFL